MHAYINAKLIFLSMKYICTRVYLTWFQCWYFLFCLFRDVMDMTDMTYDEGSMDVVIDKGALDALMSDDSGEYAHTYIHTYIHACIIT